MSADPSHRRSLASIMAAVCVVATPLVVLGADELPGTPSWLPEAAVTTTTGSGVLEIVNDGVRDLDRVGIDTGHDGSVWLRTRRSHVPIGTHAAITWPEGRSSGVLFKVAPDGVVWTVEDVADRPFVRIRSLENGTWTTHRKVRSDSIEGWALEIAADGTVWAAWPDGEVRDVVRASVVARLGPDGWRYLEMAYRGELTDIVATDDGDIWLIDLTEGPIRFTDDGWIRPSIDPEAISVGDDAFPGLHEEASLYGSVGRDGTVWLVHCPPPDNELDALGDCHALLRGAGDGHGWVGYGLPSELRRWPTVTPSTDGAVWLASSWPEDGPGLHRFDGTDWAAYLPARMVLGEPDLTIDGPVIVVSEPTHGRSSERTAIHVISP